MHAALLVKAFPIRHPQAVDELAVVAHNHEPAWNPHG
jgi:hypothetical protein